MPSMTRPAIKLPGSRPPAAQSPAGPPAPAPLPRRPPLLGRLLIAAANLLPLAGLRYWGWDAFQLLMLYWAETVIVAGLTLLRIGLLPADRLGTATVNGKRVKGTSRMMVGFFALHSGMFIAAHLFFLWMVFSDDWPSRLHGVGDAVDALFLRSGAWIVLLVMFFGGLASIAIGPDRPAFVTAFANRLGPGLLPPATPAPPGDGIGPLVGALYGRIVVMQVAIIAGAWFSRSFSSAAPLIILVLLKTLIDFFARPGPVAMTFTDNTTEIRTGTTP